MDAACTKRIVALGMLTAAGALSQSPQPAVALLSQ
jgi:hypothetical protein